MQRRRGAIPGLLRRLALCTLAGAVVTWAVAWGCALWSGTDPSKIVHGVPGPLPPSVQNTRPKTPVAFELWWHYEGPGFGWRQREWRGPNHEFLQRACVCEYGWPARSMQGRSLEEGPNLLLSSYVRPPPWILAAGGRFLPAVVLPLGFALNTALAALVLLGIVEGVGLARRRRRTRRGLCPACGYDRRGIGAGGVCPECGGAGKPVEEKRS